MSKQLAGACTQWQTSTRSGRTQDAPAASNAEHCSLSCVGSDRLPARLAEGVVLGPADAHKHTSVGHTLNSKGIWHGQQLTCRCQQQPVLRVHCKRLRRGQPKGSRVKLVDTLQKGAKPSRCNCAGEICWKAPALIWAPPVCRHCLDSIMLGQ
jgi:hypothetical protein